MGGVKEANKVIEQEYVPLKSRIWLGGADCMIPLCAIL